MLRLMPQIPNLPSILKWEISLALLVLAWSVISLRFGRSPRGAARAGRGRVVRLPSRSRSHRRYLFRKQRGRAPLVAVGFALAAASVAYALPNLVEIAPHGRRAVSRQSRLRQAERRVEAGATSPVGAPQERARPAPTEPGAPAEVVAATSGGQELSTPQGKSGGLDLGASLPGLAAGTPPVGDETTPPTPLPTPTPTPTIEPTPTPTLEPTPTPTPSPE
ncbi:hypothetical protein BH24ACT26_BH24ACT26_12250 [soil metagenome]